MALNVQSFLQTFPEFINVDPLIVESVYNQVVCETCNYDGYRPDRDAEADCLLGLHIAHVLELQKQTGTPFANGNRVKKLKTKQDEIEYFGNSNNPFAFELTSYGRRLVEAENRLYLPFIPFC